MDIWTTSEGDEIPLQKMSDSHLRNAYAYLDRKLNRPGNDEPVMGAGEFEHDTTTDTMPLLDYIRSVDRQRAADRLSDLQWRGKLEDEAARRGLKLPEKSD